jgi:putative acetyltransferase
MYFLPNLRGIGMGKKLLQHCLDGARTMGYTQMYLETVERMSAANRLYQKFGFQLLDGPLGSTGHNGCDRHYLLDL